MVQPITIETFFEFTEKICIIDVRSEGEYLSGHIPGAVNIPILSDEERKIVGTSYKHNGSQTAVVKGLELSGPHLTERLKKGVKAIGNGKVLVHCWRGGKRSEFYSFLLQYYGLEPMWLKGGYKAFRQMAHMTFASPLKIIVLSGKTGSGKTDLLKGLEAQGEQIIDLEGLAHHRGSSFGSIGMPPQPTQEQFENNLFAVIRLLNPSKRVWIEDESRTIGSNVIPEGLWTQMHRADRILVEKSFDERLEQIMTDYGSFAIEELILAMERIGKRLGPQHVKVAIEYLKTGNVKEAFEMALAYYDKAYVYLLSKHSVEIVNSIKLNDLSTSASVKKIVNTIEENGK